LGLSGEDKAFWSEAKNHNSNLNRGDNIKKGVNLILISLKYFVLLLLRNETEI